MIQDLTRGSPAQLIVRFALPLLIGNIFQQLYQISDIIIVGRLIGVEALAAVGSSAPIYFVMLLITLGFTGGLTVITAQRFGAKDKDGVRRSVTHSIMAGMGLSLISSLILIVFLPQLLRLMNVPAEIMADSYRFMVVLAAGFFMIVAYNLLSFIIRALGDSKTPLYFLIFSSVLNIFLNLFLIYVLKLGIIGSALGTVIAVSISVAACLLYIARKFPILRLTRKDWKFSWPFMKQHLNIAFPMALQFSVLSVGLMIMQSVCNSFGPDTIAAFTSALRIEQLATQPLVALGIAMATYTAQNFGAGMVKRIRQGVRVSFLMSSGFSIFIALLVRFVGENMIQVFIEDGNPHIIETGRMYLNISTMFYFFLGMIFIFRNTLQGMGHSVIPLIAGIVELAMRSFAAIYLASKIGYLGICWASPIAWVGAALVVIGGYIETIRKMDHRYLKKHMLLSNGNAKETRRLTENAGLTPAE